MIVDTVAQVERLYNSSNEVVQVEHCNNDGVVQVDNVFITMNRA